MIKILISSILSGVMISIGTIAYLNTTPIIGAFVFAIGLLSILYLKTNLFTGKVPYMKNYKELPYIITILLGNLMGCCTMFAFPHENALNIVQSKLDTHPVILFIEAILCNILIYIAVEVNKLNDKITLILAIAAFIIAGFEHSIANACFIISARIFNIDVLINILIVICGNAFGGILIHMVHRRMLD